MAAVTEVKVPDIGDFEDVPVIEVLVEVGQAVAEEDPLVALESDKATMEVPSPAAGTVEGIEVSVGDKVSEGTLLLRLSPDGDGDGDGDGGTADAEQEDTRDPAEARPEADEAQAAEESDASDEAEPKAAAAPQVQEAEDAPESGSGDGPVYASPSARRLARERGVDLATVQGSGRGGRITLEDVEGAGEGGEATPDAAEAAPAPAAAADAGDERVALTRIQKISGPRLQEAWQTIPHVTQFDEADITDLEAFRKETNASQDVKVTMVALLMKACVASLKAHPVVNASLDGEELILKRHYHLGFAADTPNGLLVPVIRDVDRKGILEIAGELIDLSGRAREGKLKGEEMRGATFTISSLGGIGGTAFTPIINPPEVAILGVSRSATKPVWDGAQFIPRLIVPLSLSYDHRVIDGALAARFTHHLAGVLGDLRKVLL